jgi:hypothetical protein
MKASYVPHTLAVLPRGNLPLPGNLLYAGLCGRRSRLNPIEQRKILLCRQSNQGLSTRSEETIVKHKGQVQGFRLTQHCFE